MAKEVVLREGEVDISHIVPINRQSFADKARAYFHKPFSLLGFALVILATLIALAMVLWLLVYVFMQGVPHLTADMFAIRWSPSNMSMLPSLINTLTIAGISLVVAGVAQALVRVHQPVRVGVRPVVGRLGAPLAVLAAAAGLGVDDGAHVERIGSHGRRNPMCGLVQPGLVAGQCQLEGFFRRDVAPLQNALCEMFYVHGIHIVWLCHICNEHGLASPVVCGRQSVFVAV